jgi:polar amino acid transport system substrate-binding protein
MFGRRMTNLAQAIISWPRFTRWGAAACLLILAAGNAEAQQRPKELVLARVVDAREGEVCINVLRKAYSRIGIKVQARGYTGAIALQKSNAGEVDGEAHRTDGIDASFPNLVQVPIPINYFDIAVFSKRSDFRPRALSDLASLRVGIARGVLAVEQATRELQTRQVDTYAELFPLLARGEVDVVAAPLVEGLDAMRRLGGMKDVVNNGILDSFLLYHYLHKSRAFLIPAIEPVLKEMLLDGTIARIRDETYADLTALNALTRR